MGKAKKATRKELEAVIGKLIQEVQYLRQGFTAIDSYLGAYVKFKGEYICIGKTPPYPTNHLEVITSVAFFR